jgi:rhamnose transport system substrate-binding protein
MSVRNDEPSTAAPFRRSFGEGGLLGLLALEILIFGATAPHFLSWANGIEIVRFSVELGLLAVALTPVIVTGGIDLSVGSMMGLAAVSFGIFWRDFHLPLPLAMTATLIVGAAGGALNATLIARVGVPPLIVTLGSMALFRGVAEGLTEAATSYSGFPGSFLALGQGYLPFGLPAQLPLFVVIVVAYAVLLHRSVIGRALRAIGFNADAARYAGLPVARRLVLVYVLSGLVASLAAIVYTAHTGQARSDAGTGYELSAITAVLLGGASVTGGRGSIHGTLVGLFILAVLQNGLQLAALPSELAGVLTGAILIAAIVIDRLRTPQTTIVTGGEEVPVKNAQVAVLCGAVLAGSLIVAGTNVWLVRSLAGPHAASAGSGVAAAPARRPVIAMMPKAKGDPYFVSARKGADEAAAELGVDLIWDGPTSLDAAKQNDLVESWITRQVDAIAVSVQNPASISTVLRKARSRGIKVLTWDADAERDSRDYFINQATPEGIGNTLTDEAARLLNERGDFAVVTSALSAPNQNAWLAVIRQRLAKYPQLRLVTVRPSDDDRDKAFAETQTILRANPTVKLIMAIAAPAVPGAAEAVRQAGRTDVKVMGLSLPNINKTYVHDDVVQVVMLWNTTNLGYLTVQAATLAARGAIPAGATSIQAGRLGAMDVRGDEVLLGKPLVMTKANIDQFDF